MVVTSILETEVHHHRAQLRSQRTQQTDTKKERAKRLVATKETIPEALWELYEADTNQEANEEDAFAESVSVGSARLR